MIAITIFALAVATFAIRAVFFVGARDRSPTRLDTLLGRVPAAVLPCLAVSALLSQTSSHDAVATLVGLDPRWPAAAVAALVAWRTRSVAGTLLAGMVALWMLQILCAETPPPTNVTAAL